MTPNRQKGSTFLLPPARFTGAHHRVMRLLPSLITCATVSCAPREFPSSFASNSPASVAAPEPSPSSVTRSLETDPPLPGDDTEGWRGLTEPEDAAALPDHVHHHHHHHAPATATETRSKGTADSQAQPGDVTTEHDHHAAPEAESKAP